LGAKLRVLLEPWAHKRPAGEDESVWAFAARRIGKDAADALVDAMVTGIYGGDSKALSLAAAFPRMRELEDQYGSLIRAQLAIAKEKKGSAAGAPTGTMCTFKEGLGELTRALAARLEVRTGFEARSIPRIQRTGGLWRIEGTGPAIEADAVVLAVPAYAAKALLLPLAEKEAEAIGGIRYPPIAVVIQAWRTADAAGAAAHGFGFLAPHLEGRRILGTIFASSVFGAHAPAGMLMLRTVVGGTRRPEAALNSDAEISQMVREELADLGVMPRNLPPAFERILRWPRAIPQYDIGHLERVAAADRVEARFPGLFLSGNAFRGVAMIACVVDADRVAARAIARLLSNEAKPAA
jgi:oxygen-dependent protoporphyrinogen oxidase